jgi:hypothetical protein
MGALAERKGFEPSIPLPVYTLSRGAPSTTRPPPRTALAVSERLSYRDLGRAQGERPEGPWGRPNSSGRLAVRASRSGARRRSG